MVMPLLNLNGTSGDELMRQVSDVLHALCDAERAMTDAAPHGRDYQHDASSALYRAALAEHRTRLSTLRALMHSYRDQQDEIDRQMSERESRRA